MAFGFASKLLATVSQEVGELFTGMRWFVIVPLCLGLVLVVAECFIPGFGVCGISGLVCIAGGIVANAVVTKSIVQTLFLVVVFVILIFVIFLILVRSARFGVISKTPFVEQKTAVPKSYVEDDEKRLSALIGKTGTAITAFMPSGKFMIDNVVYQGITQGMALDKGDKIVVIAIEGDKIIIEKLEVKNEY